MSPELAYALVLAYCAGRALYAVLAFMVRGSEPDRPKPTPYQRMKSRKGL